MLQVIRRLFQRKPEAEPPAIPKRSTLHRLQTTCIRTVVEIEAKPSSRRLDGRK